MKSLFCLYRIGARAFSLLTGIQYQCRFYPSCSRFTQEAIRAHGVVRGSILGMRRVLACQPLKGAL